VSRLSCCGVIFRQNNSVFHHFLLTNPVWRFALPTGLLLHPGELFLNVKTALNVMKLHLICTDNYTKLCADHAQLWDGNIWDEK